jgi:hypothetical protein
MFSTFLYIVGVIAAYMLGKKFYLSQNIDIRWTNAQMVGMALTSCASWLTVVYVLVAQYMKQGVVTDWMNSDAPF